MKRVVSVIVKGQPLPQPRPRMTRRGGAYMPKEYLIYRKLVADNAQAAWVGVGGLPLKGPVGLRISFYRATMVRADLDNLVKTIQDALLGIAYQDDHQIVELAARKIHGAKRPRVEIEVYDMEGI